MAPPNAPSVADVISDAITDRLTGMYTALPARVTAFDPSTRTISAQPAVRHRYVNEEGELVSEPLPVVNGIPLVVPGGGSDSLMFPTRVGDSVLLIFASADVDQWRHGANQGLANAKTSRKHSLNDAFAIPGAANVLSTDQINPSNTTVFYGETLCIGDQTAQQRVPRGDLLKDALFDLADGLAIAIVAALPPLDPALADLADVVTAFKGTFTNILSARVRIV